MSQKFWSGLTAATLLATTLGIAPISYADHPKSDDAVSEAQVPVEEPSMDQDASPLSSASEEPVAPTPTEVASDSATAEESAASTTQPAASTTAEQSSAPPPTEVAAAPPAEVVKVGEYQSEEQAEPEETITEIFDHEVNGQEAVTLYVRDIPVLTFFDSATAPSATESSAPDNPENSEVKVASVQNRSLDNSISNSQTALANPPIANSTAGTENAESNATDAVWRATTIAARLNQLHRDNIDANTITAAWDPEGQRYVIKAGEDELVEINSDTILPNSTQDLAEDTLQAANLIRRQLGNAPPLESISGAPQEHSTQVSLGSFQFSVSGLASWYGPGFDGNYSASGEVFNQNALTAAHRTLPFGTQVRVTNVDNGLSVVVRINDRGPFHGDRVIDLSTAAAEAIGLVQMGVAPVNVEVMQ